MVFENGNYRGTFGAYTAGMKLRVSVESNVVRYRMNGAVVYASGTGPTHPLRVDTSLYSTGAVIAERHARRQPRQRGDHPAHPARRLAEPGGGRARAASPSSKTAAAGWGNAGASSTKGIPAGTDGYAEFTVPADPGYVMFGLSHGDDDRGYADIDYAFYTYPPTGQLLIYENGNYRTTVGRLRPHGQAAHLGGIGHRPVLAQGCPGLHQRPDAHRRAARGHVLLLDRGGRRRRHPGGSADRHAVREPDRNRDETSGASACSGRRPSTSSWSVCRSRTHRYPDSRWCVQPLRRKSLPRAVQTSSRVVVPWYHCRPFRACYTQPA